MFDEFGEEPIAAASVAQVHKARLKSKPSDLKIDQRDNKNGIERKGEEVAVKVQYQDVSYLLDSDLTALRLLARSVAYLFPDFQLQWIVVEFDENV